MVEMVSSIELHHHAKFCPNRSNCSRNMVIFYFWRRRLPPFWILKAIFYFSKMAEVRHLGFVMRVFGPLTVGIWWSSSLWKIWLESMQYFCYYAYFSILRIWLEIAYSCPPQKKIGALGIWPPRWIAISTKPKKAHPYASPRRLSHHAWKSVDGSDL